MSSSLAAFQDAFTAALMGDDDALAASAMPGFAVYRNGVLRAGIDALAANYPSVERLVGTEWFRAAAAAYVAAHPPRDPSLWTYGEHFADWLHALPSTTELPYLYDVARLDLAWMRAYTAADAATLAPDSLQGRPLGHLVLVPRPDTQWHWAPDTPAVSIWEANRLAEPLPDPLPWQGEGVLLQRVDGAVRWQRLSQGGYVFLQACAHRIALPEAALQAQAAEPSLDLSQLLAALLGAGCFLPLESLPAAHARRNDEVSP